MNKIEPNMHVRTLFGIKKIDHIDNKKTVWKYLYKINDDNEFYALSDNDIIKASHNIIDLIEVGDYVNGYPVAYITDLGNEFGKRLSFGDETCVVASKFNFDKVYIYKEDIKSIVTKEKFESMEYRLGE